jgi:hypothetical protein
MYSFIETRLFAKLVQEYLTDDDYADLQWALMRQPEVGPVVIGSFTICVRRTG